MATSPTSSPQPITPPPTAPSAATSGTGSPTHSDASASIPQLPDTFADFIESGDRAADGSPVNVPTSIPTSAPPLESQPIESAGSFFTGLFKKATATIETTFEQAKRDISRNDVLSNAQESLSGLSNAVPTALSGMSEMVTERRFFGDRSPLVPISRSQLQLPEKTTPLKSLKVHTTNIPLLTFVNLHSQHIFIVTDSTIECFSSEGARIQEVHINEMLVADSTSSSQPPAQTSPRTSTNSSKPILATCAAYLGATDEIIVGLSDGTVRIFSVSATRVGRLIRSSSAEDSIPTIVHLSLDGPTHFFVGLNDGSVCLLDIIDLKKVTRLLPPEICAAPLGSNLRNAPVCSMGASTLESNDVTDSDASNLIHVFIGYEDGAIMQSRDKGGLVGYPFIAHGGKVSELVPLYGGVLLLAIGNEIDPSLAAFESETGRCLVRRVLPYTPTSIQIVPTSSKYLSPTDCVCPSENAFIVGGDEGQVEIFRAVVLSPKKIELRLVRRISERVRGRRRGVVQSLYRVQESTVMGLSGNGELRRWRLNKADASSLSILQEDTSVKCTYSESNIVEAIAKDFRVGDETRLSSVEGVIHAQQILASILEDDSVEEVGKDLIVEEFQKKQAEVQDMASQADAELRRTRRRIAARFSAGLAASTTDGTRTENRLARAARRTAAFELEFATRKHIERLRDIQVTAVEKLKAVLINSLRGIPDGASERIAQARREAEELGLEEETEY